MQSRRLGQPTSVADITKRPSWLAQVFSDLQRHEGFRQYAYPDPISPMGKAYPMRKYGWGSRPARIIMAELGLNEVTGRPWTVGYGFTRGVTPDSQISKEMADRMLESEIFAHVKDLDKLVPRWQLDYPLYVQTVLANMVFNLGYNKLSKFTTTLQMVKDKRFADAGRNLRSSLWYKQVGLRAVELTNRLIEGKIDDEHKV